MRRPNSLFEVAAWAHTANEFSLHLRDFLHEFQTHPSPVSFAEEPELLAGRFELGEIADAYLAAVAASLAERLTIGAPPWSRSPYRYRQSPWFASPGSAMRACLLLESPGPFRERNLFVTANALNVA